MTLLKILGESLKEFNFNSPKKKKLQKALIKAKEVVLKCGIVSRSISTYLPFLSSVNLFRLNFYFKDTDNF